MSIKLSLTRLAGGPHSSRLLIVGPSLGTSVALLWRDCAILLEDFEVIGWDLPGHGSGSGATGPFTVADIADEVERSVKALADGRSTEYAGVSFGGAVGFELATRQGSPFDALVCIAAAPRIGTPEMWRERAELVRRAGTPVMVEGSAQRWFAPGFVEREPRVAGALLRSLADTDKASYAWACEALGRFEAGDAVQAVHVLLGEHDVVVPPNEGDRVLVGCGHLPPAEDPAQVADVLTQVLKEKQCPTTTV